MTVPTTERPGTVTVVIVLTWLAAVSNILSGLVLFALANNAELLQAQDATPGEVQAIAVTWLVFAAATAAVAVGLAKGRSVARLLVTILMVLHIAAAVWAATALGTPALAEALIDFVIAALVLAFLWNGRPPPGSAAVLTEQTTVPNLVGAP